MISIKDQLLQKRRDAAEHVTLDLAIPGYGNQLVSRYRIVDPLDEGKEISANIKRQFPDDAERLFYSFVDTLVAGCTGMYFRKNDGSLELIDPDELGPMTYDERLATFLELPPTNARQTLQAVFNDNKTAIVAHHNTYMRWMEDPAGNAHLGEA